MKLRPILIHPSAHKTRLQPDRMCSHTTQWQPEKKVGIMVNTQNKNDSRQQFASPLQWGYNERDGVSNHQPHDCLLNLIFRRKSKKTSKLRVISLCEENSPVTGEFPAQRPVTRKIFPFDDVIMRYAKSTSLGCFYPRAAFRITVSKFGQVTVGLSI